MPEPVADHGKLQLRALLHADLPWPVGPNRTTDNTDTSTDTTDTGTTDNTSDGSTTDSGTTDNNALLAAVPSVTTASGSFDFTDDIVIGSSAVVSTSLSVGTVIWALRGGSLLTAFLSAMPAWQAFDSMQPLTASEALKQIETFLTEHQQNADFDTVVFRLTSLAFIAGKKGNPS